MEKNTDEFLEGADSDTNAEITKQVLSGKKGSAREMTALNAAFAFYIAGKTSSFEEGIILAEDILDSGAGMRKLGAYKEVSNS
jgi:anthranilate phosphoribosyltransferase